MPRAKHLFTVPLLVLLAVYPGPPRALAAVDAGAGKTPVTRVPDANLPPVKSGSPGPLDAAAVPAKGSTLAPAIDDLFGGADEYRKVIDRFFQVADQMDILRGKFSKLSQVVLHGLTATRTDARSCPAAEIAAPYFQAQEAGAKYLQKGRELTRHHDRIKEYDQLGETVGLTPQLRFRVKRVFERYRRLLRDYREMKVIFHDQLEGELRYRTCTKAALEPYRKSPAIDWAATESLGEVAAKENSDRFDAGVGVVPAKKGVSAAVPRPAPVSILFVIDNLRCAELVRVVLDGALLGEVDGKSRQTFVAQSGQHDLCLLTEGDRTCGVPGTVRKVYLYDGWTISQRCE